MAWFRKRGEPNQKQWSNRVAHKRQELSASVEESLAHPALVDEEWLEEEFDDGAVAHADGSSVIPPRLSLQSRPLPALRLPMPGIVEGTTVPAMVKKEPASNLLSSVENESPQKAPRRLSHTTKVRLQVVPKPQSASIPGQQPASVSEPTTSLELSAIRAAGRNQESMVNESRAALSGNGVFECGQSEASVSNPHVTEQTVVIVMLAGDPGPVVVQYVSLQPLYGFTVHLSAPTTNMTPFNYAILNSR